MRITLTILLVLPSFFAFGQFNCDNIKLLGIYHNNRNTDQLSLLITNSSPVHDGNGNVYTIISLINQEGDTVLHSNAVFALPNSTEDTIVYNVPIHSQYDHIYELPDYNCGRMVTQFPNCDLSYCFDTIPELSLPHTDWLDCSDFKIAGIYETANGGTINYSFILTNTNQDSTRSWQTSYTDFQFFDENGNPLTEQSDPSFSVPRQYGDSVMIHMNFFDFLVPGQRIFLQMNNPDCQIEYQLNGSVAVSEIAWNGYAVFPNPTKGIVRVKTDKRIHKLELFDLNGTLFLQTTRNELDVSMLEPGVYFMVINLDGRRVIEKLVKL